jgi:oxygen-independent coproporphyrinogen-3 oxidase
MPNEECDCLNLDGRYNDVFSIYVSIPFCVGKCRSCPFFKHAVVESSLGLELERYVDIIVERINHAPQRFQTAKCTAVYFGGGTASLLSIKQIRRLLDAIRKRFNLIDDCEITLEGNPLDYTRQYLNDLSGITRVSVGLQSLDDKTLKIIGTRHNKRAAEESLAALNLVRHKFKAVNIDFIYAIKTSISPTDDDLKRIIDYGFQSITLYRYDSKTHSIDKNAAWETYLHCKELLQNHNFVEGLFGFFTNKYVNVYNENLIAANEMIGLGPGSYGFINGYMTKFQNNYNEYICTNKFLTHRSINPDRQMRLDVFRILCDPSINLKARITERMYKDEIARLEGYPYF